MKSCMAFAIVAVLALCRPVAAQYNVQGSLFEGAGGMSMGGGFTNISSTGQPGGVEESADGEFLNKAGFLNSFIFKSSLDSDGDGIADEVDPDNDADGLADNAEIGGNGFSPATPTLVNVADTDGDGQLDGWESVAGTDPTNINAMLELVAISNTPSGRGVAWIARGDNHKKYVVWATADARLPYNTVIFSNTITGGSSPWFAVTTSIAHVSASNLQFYAVEVLP